MALNWYAFRSKPRKEESLAYHLQEQGIVTYYPRLRVNPINPRSSKWKAYFPGYMFIQVDLEQMGQSVFQWMPHAAGLVSFGGEPAVVPDSLIVAIRQRVEEISAQGGEVFDGLKPGDEVKIERGPFEGYDAIFDARLEGNERVRVLLKFMNERRVPVELAAAYLSQK